MGTKEEYLLYDMELGTCWGKFIVIWLLYQFAGVYGFYRCDKTPRRGDRLEDPATAAKEETAQ